MEYGTMHYVTLLIVIVAFIACLGVVYSNDDKDENITCPECGHEIILEDNE